ncbi:hypothetical protein C476_10906 [Natrinema limicola JCM 13563]|uniref:DUF1684 domain-containing protein n=2 Tax=Natrinema limicola TaxID=370323 RepID=M0CEU7_9EURY|nr:hypothetical protein C476_10906 [Natrinema limicola JCM 13563]
MATDRVLCRSHLQSSVESDQLTSPDEPYVSNPYRILQMASDWRNAIETQREQKDQYFGEHPHSPLSPDERESFDGLEYYPIDEDYRFELPLEEYDDPEQITVGTSTDGEQEYLEWGEFQFTVDGEDVTLQAYKSEPDDDRLWVPFRDATSGDETYGAGRYLDLEVDSHRTSDGDWILDFNEAYNPTCAYSDQYECPLPPMDNWLEVPIEAGEKDYGDH